MALEIVMVTEIKVSYKQLSHVFFHMWNLRGKGGLFGIWKGKGGKKG
jgi:hypothetical protein